MKKSGLFALAISAALPLAAHAENPGIYTSIAAGVNELEDANAENGTTIDNDLNFDTGWIAGGALGYAWSTGIRAELELQYLTNDVDSVDGFASASGDHSTWVVTGNLLYDFMRNSAFNPYIGIGAGAARVKWDATTSGALAIDDSETSVAIKGIAGASYKLTKNLALFGEYQYLNIVNLNFQTTTGDEAESQMENHSVLAGLRYSFGSPEAPAAPAPVAAPPPPPAPVQAVQKSRSYMIFFDFDKTAITPEARKILQQVVADVKAGNAVELQITAHADKSGTGNYNQRLSERRATSTKKELLKLGLPSVNVVMTGKGETQPMVPTPDGVREPQNRRAEIVYIVTEKP